MQESGHFTSTFLARARILHGSCRCKITLQEKSKICKKTDIFHDISARLEGRLAILQDSFSWDENWPYLLDDLGCGKYTIFFQCCAHKNVSFSRILLFFSQGYFAPVRFYARFY